MKIIKKGLAITLCLSMVVTSGIVANAEEISKGEEEYSTITEEFNDILPNKTEEVKAVNSIEELDTKDTIAKVTDSVFKSCRIIIYSDDEMEFKDIENRDNIKSVQKLICNDLCQEVN